MAIAHKTRAPLDHFAHYCAKKCPPEDPAPVARLVWYKATSIGNEFHELLNHETWPEWLANPELVDVGRGVANKPSIRNHADFYCRILQQVAQDPLNLLLLAKEKPTQFCPDRQRICERLLDRADEPLHPAALKIKLAFRDDVHECARTGRLRAPLYSLMRLVSLRWHAHVQDIEGINNIIQSVARRAPRISLPLLDARVAIRKYIGLGSRDTKDTKWEDIAPSSSIWSAIA